VKKKLTSYEADVVGHGDRPEKTRREDMQKYSRSRQLNMLKVCYNKSKYSGVSASQRTLWTVANGTSLSCRRQTSATRCVAATTLQTKVDAQSVRDGTGSRVTGSLGHRVTSHRVTSHRFTGSPGHFDRVGSGHGSVCQTGV